MRKQDYLFNLIQSLSPSERRYFNLFSKMQPGEKLYLKLFDLLSENINYEPEVLAKKLSITKANLAHQKQYLQEVLLRALRLFDESIPRLDLQARLTEAHLLFLRDQVDFALHMAEDACAKALFIEEFNIALAFLAIQSACHKRIGNWALANELNKKEKEVIAMYTEEKGFIHLRDFCSEIMMKGDNFEAIGKLADEPLFKKKEEELKSWYSKYFWHTLKAYYYHYYDRKRHIALRHSKKLVQLFEESPQFIAAMADGGGYFNALVSVSARQAKLAKHIDALATVNKTLDILHEKKKQLPAGIINRYTNISIVNKLASLTLLKRFNEAVEFLPNALAIKNELQENQRISVLYDCALTQFHTGNYKACVVTLNEGLEFKTDTRYDLQLCHRILFAMLQLQLGNFAVVPYHIKSARSWLKRKGIKITGEAVLLKWLDKLATSPTRAAYISTFAAFKRDMKQPAFMPMVTMFALDKWEVPASLNLS